jgi:hypothetical protein
MSWVWNCISIGLHRCLGVQSPVLWMKSCHVVLWSRIRITHIGTSNCRATSIWQGGERYFFKKIERDILYEGKFFFPAKKIFAPCYCTSRWVSYDKERAPRPRDWAHGIKRGNDEGRFSQKSYLYVLVTYFAQCIYLPTYIKVFLWVF